MNRQHVIFVLWVSAILTGFRMLYVYTNTAGPRAKAPLMWPTDSLTPRDKNQAQLLIFAHPKCPCSRATINELERILPRTAGKLNHHVIFVKPSDADGDWDKESLIQKAREIPGITVSIDQGGVEAKRFGALTSGQTFLFSKDGSLIFEGGITPARGHMGDSNGRAAILNFAETGSGTLIRTKAFGCYLMKPERSFGDSDL